jgi:thiol-disulfide isomerase/thioredoxin
MKAIFCSLLFLSQCLTSSTPLALAPNFRLQDMAGKAVALQDFRGKVVYVDFWFSQCIPCLAEAPAAQRLKKRFSDKEVVFLYISTDVVLEAWRAAIAKHALAGPSSVHLFDPEGIQAARAYQVEGFPTYMIISRDGHLLQRDAPRPSDGKAAERALKQALQQGS